MAAGFNLQHALNKPEGLAGFPEGCRAIFRHAGTVAGNLFQLALTGWVAFFTGKARGFLRVAMGEIDCRLIAQNNGVVELLFFDVIGGAAIEFLQRAGDFIDDPAKADFQYLAIVDADVSDTAEEVVADGENAVAHALFCPFGHIGGGERTGGFTRPVFKGLVEFIGGFFLNNERVGDTVGHSVELFFDPVIREFRTNFC